MMTPATPAITTTPPPNRIDAFENVLRAATRVLSAERADPHAFSDADLEYATDQLTLAARDLTNATYAAKHSHPVGWFPKSDGPATDLTGTIRRKPGGTVLAVLWPSPPSNDRWMVTDHWGSAGYETDETVTDWPVVGVMPFSPAAGTPADDLVAMPASAERMLRDMHTWFGIHGGWLPATPTADVPSEIRDMRWALIDEEVNRELRPALMAGDLEAIADACADAVVTIVGTAITYGLPFDRLLAEVHRSNMTKSNDPDAPKLIKGIGYQPPDIAAILASEAGATE